MDDWFVQSKPEINQKNSKVLCTQCATGGILWQAEFPKPMQKATPPQQ
jgi:hypothetical protein